MLLMVLSHPSGFINPDFTGDQQNSNVFCKALVNISPLLLADIVPLPMDVLFLTLSWLIRTYKELRWVRTRMEEPTSPSLKNC